MKFKFSLQIPDDISKDDFEERIDNYLSENSLKLIKINNDKFINFLKSDDYLHSDKLAEMACNMIIELDFKISLFIPEDMSEDDLAVKMEDYLSENLDELKDIDNNKFIKFLFDLDSTYSEELKEISCNMIVELDVVFNLDIPDDMSKKDFGVKINDYITANFDELTSNIQKDCISSFHIMYYYEEE